jgi:hypothetical protein
MTATRVWLAESTRSARARHFARVNAVGAILLSLCGNAIYHLVAVRLVVAGWVVVVAVGAVPALVLGLVSHLAVLRTQGGLESVPVPVPRAEDGPRPAATRTVRPEAGLQSASEDDLLAQARAADAAHRVEHGRPITRDALRQALRIGGTRATVILQLLKAEHLHAPAVRSSRTSVTTEMASPSD